MNKSPAYSFIKERIELEFRKLEKDKVTPWAFFLSGKELRLTNFFGKEIYYSGIGFEGSPQEVFWKGFIQPYLQNITSRSFSETREFCLTRGIGMKQPIEETAFLLKIGINRIYERMSVIDRRLLGKGFPNSVPKYNPKSEIGSSEAFVVERMAVELALAPKKRKTMKIFLSYSWNDSNIADALDILFKTKDAHLERDIREVNYRQSIKEFMKGIRKSDFCLMIISEDYLKSIKCMFEVDEFTKDENYRERILPLVRSDTGICNMSGRNKFIEYWQNKYSDVENSLATLEELNKIEALEELRQIENIKRNIGGFLQFISDINNISFKNEISKSDFDKIYAIINPSDTFLGEYKEYDGFFVLNIPRTLHEKVMTWWKQESKGYTDDLRYAKIFTKIEIEGRMKGVNWAEKFAAIPINEVAVKLGQNYIPFNWHFKKILLENKEKIIGNKNLYLSKEDIEYLI